MKNIFYLFILIVVFSSCEKDLEPYNSRTNNTALVTTEDLQIATNGVYAGLVTNGYSTLNVALFGLSEFPGDNVAQNATSGGVFTKAYNYDHTPNMSSTTNFWRESYKMIYSANNIIKKIEDGKSAELDQLKGENLFLRALLHFNLVRIYGRPYIQDQGKNPGIIIQDDTEIDYPSRNSVEEVYSFIISDLEKAADLMNLDKKPIFASKEVAYALLSRVYLYKGDNENAVTYANKVIDSKRYSLLPTESYKEYFTVVPENNSETIFAFRNTDPIASKGSLGGMYYNDPVTQSTGFGQMSASLAYTKLLNENPGDARHSFIAPQLDSNGDTIAPASVPIIYVLKYNFQEGETNLSSPVYLRLAEMFLNRAEGNAKLGNFQEAINDINIIRERAGLSGSSLLNPEDYNDISNTLDVVLKERRLELAFEGHRSYDLFRNNLPLIRSYPGFHSEDRFNQIIQPDNPRIIYFIPEHDTNINPNIIQNP